MVRALPVDPAALPAPGERVVAAARPGLEPVLDLLLGDRSELAVARGAPGPGRQRRPEPVEQIAELLVGTGAAYEGTEPQLPAAEQPPILGEQHPPLRVGHLDEGVVIEIVAVRRIDADKPQPASDGAQVHIEEKPRRRYALWPGHCEHLHVVAVGRTMGRRHRLAA
jgi:hypothetical protein